MGPQVETESIPCPVCRYPVPAPSTVGQQARCAWCGGISEAITQVTIPAPVVAGVIGFVAGVVLGPPLKQWLARKARQLG